jgi:ABC-type cobalt transport system substrate-binding protein
MTIGTISIIVGVVLLILLKFFFKEEEKSTWNEAGREVGDIIKEDPWSDPGWSTLTGNIFNDDAK